MLKAVALAAGILAAADPNVRKLGNAITQYRDATMHAVIAYEYSHRYHDAGWLMVQAAIRTTEHLTFRRDDFRLETPDGTTIVLASQQRFVGDAPIIQKIRQNASVWRRSLDSYFTDKQGGSFSLFALPGEGIVTDSIVTNRYGPSYVTLYFEAPDGHWREGTYRLTVDNGRARAVLPVELK